MKIKQKEHNITLESYLQKTKIFSKGFSISNFTWLVFFFLNAANLKKNMSYSAIEVNGAISKMVKIIFEIVEKVKL